MNLKVAKAMINYELDPSHHFTLPGYAWDAMLSKTGIELELVSHMDTYSMLEKYKRRYDSSIT